MPVKEIRDIKVGTATGGLNPYVAFEFDIDKPEVINCINVWGLTHPVNAIVIYRVIPETNVDGYDLSNYRYIPIYAESYGNTNYVSLRQEQTSHFFFLPGDKLRIVVYGTGAKKYVCEVLF